MKYILYGINRVTKDFLYIFDNLNIECIVDENFKSEEFEGYPVFKEEYFSNIPLERKIIVCGFDKEKQIKTLQKYNLEYQKDYVYEEDFFEYLDSFKIPKDRELVMWGTGKVASEFCSKYTNYEFTYFIDSFSENMTFQHKAVRKPAEVNNWKEIFIIIGVTNDHEIKEMLDSFGLQEEIDYVGFQKVTGIPSALLKETIFDRSYYDLECNTMLNHLEVLHDGETRCCCTTFLQQNLDNIMKNDLDRVWRSNLHKIMCLSSENRTYTFCDKTMCPLFVSKQKENNLYWDRPYKKMKDFPETLALGYDATCNLCCKTCRNQLFIAQGAEKEKLKDITNRIKNQYLSHCKFLILAGDGEVFLSTLYKDIYQDPNCNPDYIRLLSNGLLFNQKNWESFIKNKTSKIMLTVSIDAATKDTYEKIRRNGNFDVLQENMKFASQLRKEGALKYLRINFVVQRENFKEMPLFVQWGEELGVDEIFFTKILNWGTYKKEEFENISMMQSDGVTPKQELIEVLNNPIMGSNIVDMGTIHYAHKQDWIDVVENYYMWELEKRGGKLFE